MSDLSIRVLWEYQYSEKRAIDWIYVSVWRCPACGHVVEATPPEHRTPSGCPGCQAKADAPPEQLPLVAQP